MVRYRSAAHGRHLDIFCIIPVTLQICVVSGVLVKATAFQVHCLEIYVTNFILCGWWRIVDCFAASVSRGCYHVHKAV